MKLRSSPTLGLVCMMSVLAMDVKLDCKDVAASGLLDAVFFAAQTAVTQAQIAAANANNDQAGQDAPALDGINCWDLNGNGENDADEDVNGDGLFNALDCQGADGQDGANGANGQDGQSAQGAPGADGVAGINCWDLNGNGQADPDEDINGDGTFDALDCQGAAGANGADGANGQDGQDGAPGQDGIDVGNTIARGFIYFDNAGQVTFEQTALNITSVTRPAAGFYNVTIDFSTVTNKPTKAEDITVLVQLETLPVGSGGSVAQPRVATYGIVNFVTDTSATIEVQVARINPFQLVDSDFSIVVLGP